MWALFLGSLFGHFGGNLSKLRNDFVQVFALIGGPRPPEVGSRRKSENSSMSGLIFWGFWLNFGVPALDGSRNGARSDEKMNLKVRPNLIDFWAYFATQTRAHKTPNAPNKKPCIDLTENLSD